MAIEVICSSCQRQFHAPDTAAGKQAKCPQCGGVIQIPGTLAAVAANYGVVGASAGNEPATSTQLLDEEAASPAADAMQRRPCPMCGEMIARDAVKCRYCGEVFDASLAHALGGHRRAREPGWGKVRVGVIMLYYSALGAVVSAVLVAATISVFGQAFGAELGAPPRLGVQREGPSPVAVILLVVASLAFFAALVGWLIGQGLCIAAPSTSGARGYAVGAFTCYIAYLILVMAGTAMAQPERQLLLQVARLVLAAGLILFVLFIRHVAAYLGDSELVSSAGRYAVFAGVFVACAYALQFLARATFVPAFAIILSIFLIVFGLFGLVGYLRLLTSLKLAIDRRQAY